ncbi:hypothetical protein HYH03_015417 [Edaphochlamys debaryana]|uniref:Uncharacterized protein n=1 Tax=Edaphochlamys debaryana TaxID=47281 RepID=A0A835XLR6_9CHLO|nr:hypothetical protein HYH03_015417 [Edaphochlamys debaryana]|eukprot:KAG2485834.1 hypothetical protein HYH03_015417 [Edaphochlamys debaryana]
MSYSAYFTRANFAFPTGFAAIVGGLLYLNSGLAGRPPMGWKEVSAAEYNATPLEYLQNPERHLSRMPKVPGMSDVPSTYDELQHKLHAKGHGHH